MSELKDKTAKGLGWGFTDSVMGAGITAIVSIILARILSPAEFGLIGMTAIFISLGNSLMDSGFCNALTRKKDATDKDYNTAFYTNLIFSVILYAVLYFTAPLISSFYNIPILCGVVRYLGITIILAAISEIQKVILIRKIDFKRQAIISLVSSVTSGFIGIAMALKGFGVWSLVAQQLTKNAVSSLLLWIISSWKPSLVFSVSSFKEMFSFGSRLLVASIISVIWNEIYSLIIGKFYNPSSVGFYSRADKFKNMVTSNVSIAVQRVSYPVLSIIQDEKERQVRVYSKVLKTTMLITCTLVLGLFATSKAMILVLIGDQWIQSLPYLRILCLSGVFLPLMMISVNVINANGHSGITLKLEIIKTSLAVIPVLLGIFYSIESLLWGMVAVSLVSFLIHSYYVSTVMSYSVCSQIKDILSYFISASVMAAAVWLIGLITLPSWAVLLIQLAAGFLITVFTYEVVYKSEEYTDIKNYIFSLFR